MALTPGLYVPQGQVGTGAAYVHQIKDRSNYLEAIAKASEKQRVEQEKQMAKLKGFDYGKVTDPVMKEHISKKYKEGLGTFAAITAAGGDIASISTPEGIAFSTWQNQIKDEADTAALAESKISDFRKTVQLSPKEYDLMLAGSVTSAYENAKTPDEKLAATMDADPILLKTFDFTKWIKEEIEPAKTDKEITELGEDITKYDNVYNEKLNQVPEILASKQGINLAKKSWQIYHDREEAGFQQESFDDYVKDAIEAQRVMRQFKTESPAAKPNTYNFNLGGSGKDESLYTTYSPYDVAQINPVPDDVATTAKVVGDKLVVKYGDKAPDFAATGLNSSLSSHYNSTDKQLEVPLSKLYQFPASGKGYTLPKKKTNVRSGQDANVKGTFFTVDGSDATSEVPSKVFKDRWGNVWVQLEGQNEFVPIEAGGSIYTTNSANITKFQEVAQQNRTALKNALGKDWTDTYAEFGFDSGATEDGQ